MPDDPQPPSRPSDDSVLRLYSSVAKRPVPFTPADPARVTFYTCGPTVYDDAHIGNFRSFLAADLLARFLASPLCAVTGPDGNRHAGPREVHHVVNITDVGHMTDDDNVDGCGDDKMALAGQRLLEAKKSGKLPDGVDIDPRDPAAVAGFYLDRFIEDAAMLGLRVAQRAKRDPAMRPRLLPRATEHVDRMRDVIARLLERGAAYAAGEPGARAIYFDTWFYQPYGIVSGNTTGDLLHGAGGRVDDAQQCEKRHPTDFLLWKEDSSHLMTWPAPRAPQTAGWGPGYPGWHIECTAMSLWAFAHSGRDPFAPRDDLPNSPPIDLHSGGEDNIFPHHECENAQTCVLLKTERAVGHWFHPRFLLVEGAKMSKSKGTVYTPRELFAQGHEPAAVRLALIQTNYRVNADFSMRSLADAARQIDRWRAFADRAASGAEGPETPGQRERFARALHDDLNVSATLGMLNLWMKDTGWPTTGDARLLADLDEVLGLLSLPRLEREDSALGVYLPGAAPSDAIEALLRERAQARKAKDFARSDEIRDELAAMGLAIRDVAGGKVEIAPSA
ncbi:MAG: hypothetical protein AAF995_04620 [Planctomycetota bacterium]